MKRSIGYSEEKAFGLMFGLLFGDSSGADFNDKKPDEIPPLDAGYFLQHTSGNYTDDTQMALSVLEEMVENSQIDQTSLQKRFLRRFSHWRGYGGGMLEVIQKWQSGEPIGEAANSLYNGSGNFGDGAAIRSAPISLFFKKNEPADLSEQVTRCALITHAHPYGIAGAQLQAFAVLLALNDIPVAEWISYIFKLPIESAFKIKLGQVEKCLSEEISAYESVKYIGNGAEAIEAVPAALYAALRYPDSIVDAVSFAISMGGDCDTIAAMTGSIVGARLGIACIPVAILEKFENGPEGTDFIRNLVKRSLTSN